MESSGSPSRVPTSKKKRPSTVGADPDGVDLSKLRAHAACKNCRVKKVGRYRVSKIRIRLRKKDADNSSGKMFTLRERQ